MAQCPSSHPLAGIAAGAALVVQIVQVDEFGLCALLLCTLDGCRRVAVFPFFRGLPLNAMSFICVCQRFWDKKGRGFTRLAGTWVGVTIS